jgi:hypothetical protein
MAKVGLAVGHLHDLVSHGECPTDNRATANNEKLVLFASGYINEDGLGFEFQWQKPRKNWIEE